MNSSCNGNSNKKTIESSNDSVKKVNNSIKTKNTGTDTYSDSIPRINKYSFFGHELTVTDDNVVSDIKKICKEDKYLEYDEKKVTFQFVVFVFI